MCTLQEGGLARPRVKIGGNGDVNETKSSVRDDVFDIGMEPANSGVPKLSQSGNLRKLRISMDGLA